MVFVGAAHSASRPDSDVRVVRVPAGEATVKVRWEAEVRGVEGEFRLLTGVDFGSLRVVARVAAAVGEHGAVDLAAPTGVRVIQLQYVDPRGRLLVLATQEILIETEVHPADLWTGGISQLEIAMLTAKRSRNQDGIGALALPAAARQANLALQPPTPPPRSARWDGSQSRA